MSKSSGLKALKIQPMPKPFTSNDRKMGEQEAKAMGIPGIMKFRRTSTKTGKRGI